MIRDQGPGIRDQGSADARYTREMKLIAGVFALALFVSGCGGDSGSAIPTAPSANVPFSTIDVRVGTGAEAVAGRFLSTRYSLWTYSATATENKGTAVESGPYNFTLASGAAIQGYLNGVTGMRVGGLRRVIVPPSLAYGNNPPPGGQIRANETLVFEIELLGVQ
jgi:FKBP-type peptidyl-prolyl cis-trans isomerase FkpA